jgi:hypothetical protein
MTNAVATTGLKPMYDVRPPRPAIDVLKPTQPVPGALFRTRAMHLKPQAALDDQKGIRR